MGDEIPSEFYNRKCPACGHMNLYFRNWCFNCITRLPLPEEPPHHLRLLVGTLREAEELRARYSDLVAAATKLSEVVHRLSCTCLRRKSSSR